MLEARHQIFNGLHPAPFIEDLSLGLNDALLSGLDDAPWSSSSLG
jgi:hypothetical protein